MATRDKGEIRYLEDVELTARRARTHIGIIRDPDHDQPWIVAISEKPGYLTTLDYLGRWGIEPMFPNFKSRGFPKSHWAKLHSTNPIEQLNKEVKRRADVIGIFPNEDITTSPGRSAPPRSGGP